VRIKGLWGSQAKTYFYVNFEAFRIRGGVNTSTISIPSLKERRGDFSGWVDEQENLIPVYDPATTRPNPAYDLSLEAGPTNLPYLRDQFMGCDGRSPNVICPARIQNSLARVWFKYLPEPTNSNPTLNYVPPKPVPDIALSRSNYWLIKVDHYFRSNDHFAVTIYYQGASPDIHTILPEPIAYEDFTAPQYSFVNRFNWDHTFSPTLLNHFAYGYLNRNEAFGAINAGYVDQFPKIPGVAAYTGPPAIPFWSDGFTGFGSNTGSNIGNLTTRPAHILNDLLTWVRGKHTLKFGGEYRNLGGSAHSGGNQMGTFGFGRTETGLLGLNSGNPIASFLLEAVDYAWVDFRTVSSNYPRQRAYIAHFGDTWKVTPKWSFNYGLRWDLFTPFWEKYDHLSFFDPYGPNPGAGGRPGRLAFAGNSWGAASYGKRYPELTDWKAFAPRVGLTYGLNDRTVVRAGYGIFLTSAFYPNWNGGIALDGFNATPAFGSSQGGMEPAFYLSEGFPQDFQRPPFIDSSYQNGRDTLYRPLDGNRRPYAQHWNLTIERQLPKDLFLSVAYVGTKGTRLPSIIAPLNVLDPKLLSMGFKLYDQFQPGDTSLHGVPLPYPGWVEQLQGCGLGGASVAQALLPYPQYCSGLPALTESAGNSSYHSFQAKVEKRFSGGLFLLGSYTFSKLLSSAADNVQSLSWSATQGVISPFERWRNKSLATDDVPQVFSLALVYDLPFGRGKTFLNQNPVANAILGGWSVSSIFRASSGIPFSFRDWNTCVVPGQFWAGCIPTVLPGANPWAQDKAHFDPNQPLFWKEAFEPEISFSFYLGKGPRVSNLRGFGYHNQDFALVKETRLSEKLRWQIRAEFFNLWNWHIFNASGAGGSSAFDTDISSPTFGMWNGAVTNPRNIQVGTRLTF
jgi:hypothetical protein